LSRRLLILNGLLAALSLVSAGAIVRELTAPLPAPAPARSRPPAPPAAPAAPAPPGGSYALVASRNLFSPDRTEAPAGGGPTASAAPQLPKPFLYGVVLRDGAPIAYLEDPVTKRVAGYRIGDAVAGGTLQSIAADRVVLARPDGQIDVRLRDPSKPRPPAGPPGGAPVPAAPGRGAPVPPAVMPPPVAPPAVPPAPEQESRPAAGVPPSFSSQFDPGRRVLPPTLRRRVPPGFGTDATTE